MARPDLGRVAHMSVARATFFASRIVELSAKGEGDLPNAIKRVAKEYGFSPSHVERVRKGRLKTMDVSVFARWRMAYLNFCQAQVEALQHDLAVERAMGADDDSMENFESEARELAQKVASAKAQASASRKN